MTDPPRPAEPAPLASREDISWTANFQALVALGAEIGINPGYLHRALTAEQVERVLRTMRHLEQVRAARDAAADPLA